MSLEIKPNETTAIVGHSGCGKSTIPKLIFQFYSPQSGNILLDGTDVTSLDYDWLRKNISMVPQDPELFADSIRYDLKMFFKCKITFFFLYGSAEI
jgi:ABC-type multidrug transport system fused ATPase/permease subunit